MAALPAAAWYGYVQLHTRSYDSRAYFVPLSAVWNALLHPFEYPPEVRLVWLARAGDYLAITGMLAAFALSLRWLRRGNFTPPILAGLCFTALGIILQIDDLWIHVFNFGRVYSPLLLFLALDGMKRRRWFEVVPLCLLEPRVAMQLGNQAFGMISALLRW